VPDPFKQFQLFQINHQPQNCLASVLHDPTCDLHHFPSKGSDRLLHPKLRTREPFEPNKKIVGNDPDPKENSIGVTLPTRHAFHPDPILYLFIKVLCLPPLIMPLQYLTCIFLLLQPVRRYSMIKIGPPLPSNKSLCLRISRFTTRRKAFFVPFMQ